MADLLERTSNPEVLLSTKPIEHGPIEGAVDIEKPVSDGLTDDAAALDRTREQIDAFTAEPRRTEAELKAVLAAQIQADVAQFKQELNLGSGWLNKLTSAMPKVRAFWRHRYMGWARLGLGLGLTAGLIASAVTGAWTLAFGAATARMLLGFVSTFMAGQELQASIERQRETGSSKEALGDTSQHWLKRGWNAAKNFLTDGYDAKITALEPEASRKDHFLARHEARTLMGQILVEEAKQSKTNRDTTTMEAEVVDRLATEQARRLSDPRIRARYERMLRQGGLSDLTAAELEEIIVGRAVRIRGMQVEDVRPLLEGGGHDSFEVGENGRAPKKNLRQQIRTGQQAARTRTRNSLLAASAVSATIGLIGTDFSRLAETGKWIANAATDLWNRPTDTLARFLNWQDQMTDIAQDRIWNAPSRLVIALTDLKHRLDQPLMGVAEAAPATPTTFADKLPALARALQGMAQAQTHDERVAAIAFAKKAFNGDGKDYLFDGKLASILKRHANDLAQDPERLRKLLSIADQKQLSFIASQPQSQLLAAIDESYAAKAGRALTGLIHGRDSLVSVDAKGTVIGVHVGATFRPDLAAYVTPAAHGTDFTFEEGKFSEDMTAGRWVKPVPALRDTDGTFRNAAARTMNPAIDAARTAPGTYSDAPSRHEDAVKATARANAAQWGTHPAYHTPTAARMNAQLRVDLFAPHSYADPVSRAMNLQIQSTQTEINGVPTYTDGKFNINRLPKSIKISPSSPTSSTFGSGPQSSHSLEGVLLASGGDATGMSTDVAFGNGATNKANDTYHALQRSLKTFAEQRTEAHRRALAQAAYQAGHDFAPVKAMLTGHAQELVANQPALRDFLSITGKNALNRVHSLADISREYTAQHSLAPSLAAKVVAKVTKAAAKAANATVTQPAVPAKLPAFATVREVEDLTADPAKLRQITHAMATSDQFVRAIGDSDAHQSVLTTIRAADTAGQPLAVTRVIKVGDGTQWYETRVDGQVVKVRLDAHGNVADGVAKIRAGTTKEVVNPVGRITKANLLDHEAGTDQKNMPVILKSRRAEPAPRPVAPPVVHPVTPLVHPTEDTRLWDEPVRGSVERGDDAATATPAPRPVAPSPAPTPESARPTPSGPQSTFVPQTAIGSRTAPAFRESPVTDLPRPASFSPDPPPAAPPSL